MTLRWKCAEYGCYRDQLPDWGMLDGCFGDTRVKPSDIDGYIYQRGKCLFIEKKHPNGWITSPQLRSIEGLVLQGNSFVAIWCTRTDGADISLMRTWGIPGYPESRPFEASLEVFREAVKAWWKMVYGDEQR